MKMPFVPRSRHQEAVGKLEEKLANAKKRQAELGEKLKSVTEARGRELDHLRALSKLCEELKAELQRLLQQKAEANPLRMALLDRVAAARAGNFQRRQHRIPVVLGVDVEPDARTVELADPSWRGTEVFFDKWHDLRSRLAKVSGDDHVPLTWFPRADPQVEKSNGAAAFALRNFARQWDTALRAGDEIGLHMHPWRWDDQGGHWSQDHGDAAWVEHCLRSSIAEYRAHFGTSPPVYRGGDHYLDDNLIRVLEEEGIALDMTLELLPAKARLVEEEHGTGLLPDCVGAPVFAYRPSSTDFRIPDPHKTEGLGILPLTPFRDETLCLWLDNQDVDEALEQIIQQETAPSHLAFVVRSNIADTGYWEAFVENALSLARRVREGSLEFVTATQAWSHAMKGSAAAEGSSGRVDLVG